MNMCLFQNAPATHYRRARDQQPSKCSLGWLATALPEPKSEFVSSKVSLMKPAQQAIVSSLRPIYFRLVVSHTEGLFGMSINFFDGLDLVGIVYKKAMPFIGLCTLVLMIMSGTFRRWVFNQAVQKTLAIAAPMTRVIQDGISQQLKALPPPPSHPAARP